MPKIGEERSGIMSNEIKKSRFPASLFAFYFAVVLLMSGVHTAIIVLGLYGSWSDFWIVNIPIIYWGIVAVGMTIYTRKKMEKTYEEPLKNLAKATEKVANGDFSVYVPTLNSADRYDYLDVMIMDFNKMVEELGSIETLKTDFVSNVSHEMKTPIAIIKNYAELLQKEELEEEKRMEYAKGIKDASNRLSGLISNILKLNKLENQSITPLPQKYDVCRQLCDCVLQYENIWEEKEIEIDIDMEDAAFVIADESLMEIVWNNLLSNAFKFTESGGSVAVVQKTTEEGIVVKVSDTGCGMSEENIKHIFDKFYQGDTSHSKEGNGLGMAMVKRVVDMVNGKIFVESIKGKGSTFTVILPKLEADKV